MVTSVHIAGFKSLRDVSMDLGQVNVFIGANGSGKSNILEALGLLGAAAFGRIDDEALSRRGVRLGIPALYKSSFRGKNTPSNIRLEMGWANGDDEAAYAVSLHNPIKKPEPAWGYKTELLTEGDEKIVGASPHSKEARDPTAGLAALKLVELDEERPASRAIRVLQDYCIYAPTTSILRGLDRDMQQRDPVGLAGGGLPQALYQVFSRLLPDSDRRAPLREVVDLIGWADRVGVAPRSSQRLSPSVPSGPFVIEFQDRFMGARRNILTGYDASEGALYVLFAAVLALHPNAPELLAVDNFLHLLNPRLARALMRAFCEWVMEREQPQQVLLTTHNPLVLDGLDLSDERVRLFAVDRASSGETVVQRIAVDEKLLAMAQKDWPLSRLWINGELGGVPNV